MTRAGAGVVVAIALIAGLALRAARLDVRPMHHDEANQVIKFGALLERGEYRYDRHDHHGPTLYYLTLPAAWLRGQHTLAALDEITLRAVPVAFGAATILLLTLLSRAIGRTAVASAAILMALSPAMVFYSRMYIQEALFACFALAFAIALGRVATGGGVAWSVLAGAAAGLTAATKETAIIVLPAAVVACAIAWWSVQAGRTTKPLGARQWRTAAVVILASAGAVAALFYSSFFAEPGAMFEPFRGAGTYLGRGIDPASHAHPWHYYLRLLAWSSSGGARWSEGLVLLLATAGAVMAWRRPHASARDDSGKATEQHRSTQIPSRVFPGSSVPSHPFWARYLTLDTVLAAVIFSAIPYKTPWNLLPFYVTAFALAGIGVAWLVDTARSRALRAALVAVIAVASLQLAWQAWRAAVVYAADPRNPYVYAQTVPDAVRMAARIRSLAALHRDGLRMQVSVVAPPHEQWPLPWYLRTMANVGYWDAPGDALALQAPVIVSSIDHAPVFDHALGDRYVSEMFGLRPDVLLAVYIERGLWERFLAQAAVGTASTR